jgi:MFS family permease
VQRESNNALSGRSGGFTGIFRSLKYRNYRLFFSGQSVSLIGTWIQRLAMPWLVYHITDSTLLLGVVGFAAQIPTFILAPFAGALVDRWNRYHVLIITQILATLQSLALAFFFFTGIIQVWHIVILSILLGCINAIDMPARQSFVVEMIEKRQDLGNAIALNSLMVNGARFIGPSLAGVLIAATNEGICFLINGITYFFVIVSLLMMKIPKKTIKPQHPRVLKGIKEGFGYTFGFAPIRYIILLLSVISLMGMPYAVLMPVFAKDILHGGSHTFGFLMGASGTGALISAVYMAYRKSVLGLDRLIPVSAAVFGTGLIVFSISRIFWMSLTLMFISGFGMLMQMTASNTIIQTIVDDDKRGRVMSFYMMAFVGTAPFGSLLAGAIATSLGAPNTLLIGGIFCVLGAVVFSINLPSLRKMIQPIYVRMGIIPKTAQRKYPREF